VAPISAAIAFILSSPSKDLGNSGRTHKGQVLRTHRVLLVGQTLLRFSQLLGHVPTRPSQNDPERVAAWELRRREVGERIRTLRIERGLTQEALALRSGVTRNVLIDVELGRRGLLYERLFDIAEALQVPAGHLLGKKP
jgi:DNA-binding XRE family transcriptional regulator